MAGIVHHRGVAHQLTAGIRRANRKINGQEAVAASCFDAASLYTNIGDIADGAACHDDFFGILTDCCAAVDDFLKQADSMAASFAELDAEQARASASAIGG